MMLNKHRKKISADVEKPAKLMHLGAKVLEIVIRANMKRKPRRRKHSRSGQVKCLICIPCRCRLS
jgi:hypothetical protein